MPNVPNINDLQRAQRQASDWLSFARVVDQFSVNGQAAPILLPTPTPTPTNPFIYNYVINNNAVITISDPEVPNYIIVTTTVETFSATFDSQVLGFTNYFISVIFLTAAWLLITVTGCQLITKKFL